MKFLVVSDIHGELEQLEKLAPECKKADAVLFGGDFAKFEHTETAAPVLEKLCAMHENVFAVLGNCDEPDFLSAVEAKDISVQGSLSFCDGIAVCGSGGGSKFTGTTPFERTEDELVSDYSVLDGADIGGNLILIMHNPPKDTKCDMIPNGMHVGSEKLRACIEKLRPVAVVTGHIHESAGIDTVGDSTVINPGSLAEGKYAWLEVEKTDGAWKVQKAELCSL